MSQYDSHSQILLAFKARIIEKMPAATNSNVWIDDAPIPFGKDAPPHKECFTIYADDGQFDPEWSGNFCSLSEKSSILITHMLKFQVDDTKKLTQIIAANQVRSMMKTKAEMLTGILWEPAGTPQDPADPLPARAPWNPTNAEGRSLFDVLHPGVCVSPKRHKDWPLLYQYIEFKFTFFWRF